MPEMDLRQIDALVGKYIMGFTCERKRAGRCDGHVHTVCAACGETGHGNCYGKIGGIIDQSDRGKVQIECCTEVPWYSSDPTDTWQVVEKLNALGWEVTIIVDPDGGATVNLERFNVENGCTEKTGAGGTSMARALSLAALRAVGVEAPDHA